MVSFIILFSVVMLVVYYRNQAQTTYEAALREAAPIRSAIVPFPLKYKEILVKYFPYYNRLPYHQQQAFEQKLLYFILSKKWVSRQ